MSGYPTGSRALPRRSAFAKLHRPVCRRHDHRAAGCRRIHTLAAGEAARDGTFELRHPAGPSRRPDLLPKAGNDRIHERVRCSPAGSPLSESPRCAMATVRRVVRIYGSTTTGAAAARRRSTFGIPRGTSCRPPGDRAPRRRAPDLAAHRLFSANQGRESSRWDFQGSSSTAYARWERTSRAHHLRRLRRCIDDKSTGADPRLWLGLHLRRRGRLFSPSPRAPRGGRLAGHPAARIGQSFSISPVEALTASSGVRNVVAPAVRPFAASSCRSPRNCPRAGHASPPTAAPRLTSLVGGAVELHEPADQGRRWAIRRRISTSGGARSRWATSTATSTGIWRSASPRTHWRTDPGPARQGRHPMALIYGGPTGLARGQCLVPPVNPGPVPTWRQEPSDHFWLCARRWRFRQRRGRSDPAVGVCNETIRWRR